MKKFISVILSILIAVFIPLYAFAQTTCYKTPIDNYTVNYQIKLGNGYKSSPQPPVLYRGYIITHANGTLYKINANNGKTIKTQSTGAVNFYATVPPAIDNNIIYLQLDSGIIKAFSFDSLTPLWTYTNKNAGQALCPIVCDNGYIYTGFWNKENEYADYVCLLGKDEKSDTQNEVKNAVWTYSSKGGFYWSKPAVTNSYLILGTDNGEENISATSKILAINKKTGKVSSSLSLKGDFRCGIVFTKNTQRYYTVSKAGYLYSFAFNESTGTLHTLKQSFFGAEATSTPIVYNGRVYLAYNKKGTCYFAVYNENTLKEIYSQKIEGYIQGDMLLSDYYFSSTGKVYLYATYNKLPGGLLIIEDTAGQTSAVIKDFFIPEKSFQQFCISPVICDKDGNIYYKNDSGTIFSIGLDTSTASNKNIFKILTSRIIEFFKKLILLLNPRK